MGALLQAARYSAACARTRAVMASLIPDERWPALLATPDLPTLLEQLESTWHREALLAAAGERSAVAQVERALSGHLVAAARLPLGLLSGNVERLLDWFWRRFELANLKSIVRGIHHQIAPEQVRRSLTDLGPASSLLWSDLTALPSVGGVVQRLAGTWYGRVLASARDAYRREQSVFPLEVALDLGYFREILDRINALSGRDRDDATAFLRTWVDFQNLLWAYRYRHYGQLSAEEILNYTLHLNLRVDAEVVRSVALGTPVLDVVRELWNGRIAGLEELAGLPATEMLPRLELVFQRHLYAFAQQVRTTFPLGLASVLAYEFLLDGEQHDLVALTEGKALGWSAARIRPYLIGARG